MKVLVLCDNLSTGGIEKSYVNFMNNFLKGNEKVEIWYMLMSKTGTYVSEIPEDINYINYDGEDIFNISWKGRKSVKSPFKLFIAKVCEKMGLKRLYYKILFPSVKQKFDVILTFRVKPQLLQYAKYNIRARKRVAMHHGFSESLFMGTGKKGEDKKLLDTSFKYVDELWTVSESCMKTFNSYKKYKFDYLYNTFNDLSVLKKQEEFEVKYKKDALNFCSAIRFSEEKAPIRTINQFIKLKNEGYKFYWHIAGDGPLFEEAKKIIKENDLEKNIILYGNQKNPYPYIKQSDVFLLLSVFEAAPMVYAEAMTLGVPVLTTDLISAEELVGEKGFICGNSEEGIYEGLKYVLDNPEMIKQKKENLKNYSYDNEGIKERFYRLIEKL